MLSLFRNLQIGTKLAIASALGIVLVLAMIASQMVGNGHVRRSNQAAFAQQELAREAVEAKFSVRSMQLAVRDIRLANNSGEGERCARRTFRPTGQGCRCNAQAVARGGKSREDGDAQDPRRKLSQGRAASRLGAE
ncbi:hypothetical protein [Bradyrhizobium liaoningense]